MAGDQGEARRRASDSLVAAVGEAVAAGYRVGDHVVEGVNESVRRKSASRFARTASARGQTARATGRRSGSTRTSAAAEEAAPQTIVGDIADLTADMLERMGEAARDIAGHIAERDRFEVPSDVPRLELEGAPGRTVAGKFWFRNTSGMALKEIAFYSTDLLGGGDAINNGAVRFEHDGGARVERMRPGELTSVIVVVEIPADAPADSYRGVIAARRERRYASESVGAWALLELEVLATDPRRR